ncbi:hypothetical protein COCNU_05G003810 [Cocos nucifera]|uniref:Transcriptional adapter 2-alpha/beta-like domain-containing protein n=1 Tax=Cocos nucifera TaxID=13894 RepID=A0A8K0I7X3_COCNU|nr:hypothetical protein COCNU_05G003810 [Cocos nucifera]
MVIANGRNARLGRAEGLRARGEKEAEMWSVTKNRHNKEHVMRQGALIGLNKVGDLTKKPECDGLFKLELVWDWFRPGSLIKWPIGGTTGLFQVGTGLGLVEAIKGPIGGTTGILVPQNASPKAESLFSSSGLKIEMPNREAPAEQYSSSTAGVWTGGDCTNMSSTAANLKAPNMVKFKNGSGGTRLESSTSAEGTHGDTSSGIKKRKDPGDNGLSLSELSGYNPKTQEFDPEYDDDAEKALADMKFMPNDTEIHHELKLRMLHIYCSRLDERKRRKDFILQRNLLHTIPLEKELSVEDREVYEQYKVFMRYQSPEEHDALVQSVIEERKLQRRIQELQECRTAGCRTMAEAKAYIEQKKLRELETSMNKTKLDSQVSSSSKIVRANALSNEEDGLLDGSPQNINEGNGGSGLELDGKDPSSVATIQVTSKSFDVWDVTGLPGADLLSETEQRLCCECKLLPCHYLKIQEVLMTEIYKGTIVKKSDAYSFFNVDPSKINKVYDMEQRLCCECKLLPCHYLKIQEVLMTEIYKGTIVKKSDAYSFFNVDPSKINKVYDMLSKWCKRLLYYLSYLMEPPMENLLPWDLWKAHSNEVSGGIQSISLRHANFSAFLIRLLSILHFVKATTSDERINYDANGIYYDGGRIQIAIMDRNTTYQELV